MNILDQVLTELALPLTAKRVYVFLAENGAASARTIAERLSLPRTSIYDHVAPLIETGVVTLIERDGKKVFSVSSVDELIRLMRSRQERVSMLTNTLAHERDTLVKQIETINPKIKFFEGKDGIAQILIDMLWEGVEEVRTVWPYYEMLQVLGEDALEEFNRKRIRHKIGLRSVWTDRPKGNAHIWQGGDYKVERRYAPRGFTPVMGYSLYKDKVMFVSSHDEYYGFIVHSKDFSKLQSAQFELLWSMSKAEK
jgi:sugar-specific transcriptional regulator TrmB